MYSNVKFFKAVSFLVEKNERLNLIYEVRLSLFEMNASLLESQTNYIVMIPIEHSHGSKMRELGMGTTFQFYLK